MYEQMILHYRQKQKLSLFSKASKQALASTQHPVQQLPAGRGGGLFTRHMKLIYCFVNA
jgi:hypothetical protein